MNKKIYYHYLNENLVNFISSKENEKYGNLLNKIVGIRTEEELSKNSELEVGSVYSTTSGRKIKVLNIL